MRDLAAGHGVAREREEREQVRVLRGDRDQPVLVRRVPGDEVLGQPVERGGGHQRRTTPVADVAVERLAEVGQPLVERADPLAGLLVAVDAGPPEVAQRLVEHPLGADVERLAVDRAEQGEHVGVEEQIRAEGLHLELDLLREPDHGRVGVHDGEQGAGSGGVVEGDPRVVPDLEDRLVLGGGVLEGRDRVARMPELAAGAVLEPALPVVDGQGEGFRCHVPTVKVEVNPASTPRLEG